MSCPTTSSTSCGCLYPSNTGCVTWKGTSIYCGETLIAKQGDTVTDILTNITDVFCNGVVPTGMVEYITEGGTGITVTSVTIGDTVTYTVALSNTVQNTITNLVSDVSSLEACALTSIQEITTSTPGMTVSNNGVSGCGKTWSVDYTPSGSVSLGGIVYNNVEKSGTSGGTGDKLLKSYTGTFSSSNSIANGDDIIYTATGQIKGDGNLADNVKLELWSGGIAVYSQSFGGFSAGNTSYSSWLSKIVLTVSDQAVGEALLNLEFSANIEANETLGVLGKNCGLQVNKEITGIDYDDLQIRVIYVHDSTSGASVNFARQLKVEVNKYIV